ncbi:MAG: WGR domain-containing protein [Verrucomicrobiota bacterium]
MRLIQQARLFFQEGTSDKVYEVDLCEAGDGEFLVNFRYGRRGTSLKEGTKTPFPEPREKAEAIFEKLVTEKTRKGYQEGVAPEKAATEVKPAAPGGGGDFHRQKVREHLRNAAEGKPPENWKLSRLIWRAGELGLSDSVEQMTKLSGKDEMTDYALAWALGRCGSADAVPKLRDLRQHGAAKVLRIATEALLLCTEGKEREDLISELLATLPENWRAALSNADELKQAVAQTLESDKESPPHLETLYQVAMAEPTAREAVYEAAGNLPLKVPYFRSLRHLFKAAELRLDAEIYGLLVHRFEKTRESYHFGWGFIWDPVERKSVPLAEEQKKPDTRYAYSDRTRHYFRNRNVRTLRRAGDLGDAATFVTLATGVLMAYDDEHDRHHPRTDTRYDWTDGNWSTFDIHYDDFANYLGLNFLLYQNSPRYARKRSAPAWHCVGSYEPGQPAPTTREEAYPRIWDQAPDALKHLLSNSRCGRVHEFAAKVWKANPDFTKTVDRPFILALLGQAYEVTQRLGLEMAKEIYDSANPDKELIFALLACGLEEGRLIGLGWLRANSALVGDDPDLATRALMIPHPDAHAGIRDLLASQTLSDDFLNALVPKIVAELLALTDDESDRDVAGQVCETLLTVAPTKLGEVGYDTVRDLLKHPLNEVQAFGGQIVLNKPGPTDDVPDDIFHALLRAEAENVRVVGMQVFGRLSDTALLERSDMLASFCISDQAEVREASRPIVERLASQDASFAKEIVQRFYPILLRKEEIEGMHEDVFALLRGPLVKYLDVIPPDSCFRMLDSNYRCGQLLGLLILKKFVGLKTQRMSRIARLASAETKEVREYVWDHFREFPDRVKENREDATRIVDSDWEDTRQFAFLYFRETFAEEDWTPEILVSLCDSVREDVQDFGRELITKFFKSEHGPDYLLKLSQHPSSKLQTFASNYLERFATDDLERLRSLQWYFLAVLSQVNRGRIAKNRALRFLETEALKSVEAAEFVSQILIRQSATIAIQDKAVILRALLSISKKWPTISVPFHAKPLPVATIN